MHSPDFGKSVRAMTRALTYVSDHSHINAVASIKHGNEMSHAIGLGAMGLHTYLALNHCAMVLQKRWNLSVSILCY